MIEGLIKSILKGYIGIAVIILTILVALLIFILGIPPEFRLALLS